MTQDPVTSGSEHRAADPQRSAVRDLRAAAPLPSGTADASALSDAGPAGTSGPAADESASGAVIDRDERSFVLQKVQPALLGLMDGAVSTLAPLFAAAGLTGRSSEAFYVGLAASVGAGISMGLAEALSDDGSVTGRGSPLIRGAITGVATTLGGMLHTLPFLIGNLRLALHLAYAVVIVELLAIAVIRFRYMKTPLAATIIQVIIGGGVVFAIGLWLGQLGAGG